MSKFVLCVSLILSAEVELTPWHFLLPPFLPNKDHSCLSLLIHQEMHLRLFFFHTILFSECALTMNNFRMAAYPKNNSSWSSNNGSIQNKTWHPFGAVSCGGSNGIWQRICVQISLGAVLFFFYCLLIQLNFCIEKITVRVRNSSLGSLKCLIRSFTLGEFLNTNSCEYLCVIFNRNKPFINLPFAEDKMSPKENCSTSL